MDAIEIITATKVPEAKRMNMLYLAFGKVCTHFESLVFSYAKRLCAEYTGGYWEFYLLSNGALYMTPPDAMELRSPNGFTGRMSADAVGIAVCLFAACHLSVLTRTNGATEAFHRLREFALDHDEASAIFAAID